MNKIKISRIRTLRRIHVSWAISHKCYVSAGDVRGHGHGPVDRMTPDEESQFRARQKSRSLVMALILGALVVLFFAITIAKIQGGHA